jgi:hypothetical protein
MNVKNENSGFFSQIFKAAKNITQKATQSVTNVMSNNSKNNARNNSRNTAIKNSVKPVTAGINIRTNLNSVNNTARMKGGMASVRYNVPLNQRQPSEEIMEWATTAGVSTPSGPQMRNVAHGGKRRTHRKRRAHTKRAHTKRHIKHKKHRSMKRKVHYRNKRRN